MTTRFTLVFLAFAITGFCQSPDLQNNTTSSAKGFSISGSAGYGFPTELYASQNYPGGELTNNIGFADPGLHLDANVSDLVSAHFGFTIEADGNFNPLNSKARLWFQPIQGYWLLGSVCTGPLYCYTFKNGNIFQTKLLIGLVTLHEMVSGYAEPIFTSMGAGAEFGVKYKFRLPEKFYLTLDAAFTQTTPIMPSYYDFGGRFAIFSSGLGVEYKF